MSNETQNSTKNRRNRRLLLLFLVAGITMVTLIGVSYAWFVGLGDVHINTFNISLNTGEALEISLDGYTWSNTIDISENNIKAHSAGGNAYEANTNHWVGPDGLVPVSTSGNNVNGKLEFFSKTSMTATGGGYRILSDKIDNLLEEKNFYVTFDIFVKNNTGDVYNPDYNLLDDENIYLITDSSVTGTASGAGSYGVQNSARVAFVQIGRISLDNLVAGATPVIKCQTPSGSEAYTPLCSQETNHYRTMIWEPNELDHDSKLLTFYNNVCKQKTAPNVYTNNLCTNLSSGYVPTYTVRRNIVASDNVDIYDGLNSYNDTVTLQSQSNDTPLQNTVTLTDTMKDTDGEYTLMKLHPHSVTKIRVYVYLEGQDVDNYDLITKDVDIKVAFGFTKERSFYGTPAPDNTFMKASTGVAMLSVQGEVGQGAVGTFRSEADLSTLESVKIDGNVIDSSNYSTASGSTIVKLNASFTNSLSLGNHSIEIVSEEGTASALFDIVDAISFTINGVVYKTSPNITWGDWIRETGGSSTGNGVLWVTTAAGLTDSQIANDSAFQPGGVWERYKNDTASHGRALMLYMEIPSHYVNGHVTLPTEEFHKWTGSNQIIQTYSDVITNRGIYGGREYLLYNYSCFDPGTKVTMADGTLKNIEDVKAGDEIMSYNMKTEKFEKDTVIKPVVRENSDDLVYVYLSNGTRLGMRGYHPLLTPTGYKSLRPKFAESVMDKGFKVEQLNVGDAVIGINGNATVVKIEERAPESNYTTYSLTVQNNHNYLADGFVAHNCPT